MTTYFQGNSEHPQHISVGAILVNDKKEVCCHHLYTNNLPKGYWAEEKVDDFYILMRETVKPFEPLEAAVHRGIMEEFGATAELVDYVGSLQSHFTHNGVEVEKTTLYFLCKLKDQDLSRRKGEDIEESSQVEWKPADFLIERMRPQAERFKRTDVDESGILERAVELKLL
jgi:hypothetical protein